VKNLPGDPIKIKFDVVFRWLNIKNKLTKMHVHNLNFVCLEGKEIHNKSLSQRQ